MMFGSVIIVCLAFVINGLPIEDNTEHKSLKAVSPELIGGGFEGDILLPPGIVSSRGVADIAASRRWPNQIIPYDLSAITNANDQATIINAMNQLMFDVGTTMPGQTVRKVCVFFRQSQPTDAEVLKIKYGNGCSASIGYGRGYEKTLNLQPTSCFHNGIVQHELTHVLGFFHEQSRPDRDSYITVHEANIEPSQLHNFQKLNWGTDVENQGFNYDYGSIMHYPRDAFTRNKQPTITPNQNNAVIGQREKLSATDIAEIRHYYKC